MQTVAAAVNTNKFNSFGSSKAGKTLKRLETQRMARTKASGQELMKSLKRADAEARADLVQDLRDITDVVAELLTAKEDDAPKPEDLSK